MPFQFDIAGVLHQFTRVPDARPAASRLDLPFLSVLIEFTPVERNAARTLLIRLRDRRVLSARECCDGCIDDALRSLQEIRSILLDQQVELANDSGRPVPILDVESGQAIITREGEDSDEHGIMTVPLRALRRPGDPPVAPLEDTETGPPEPTEYFAYGSNMATARLRARMPSAQPLGLATLLGHELRFHKRSKDKSAKCDAFATEDGEGAVIGVLFKFDPAERSALDAAEGAGKGYDAKVVTVINSQGRRRKVLTYLASPGAIDDGLKPYGWYKAHVLAGAKEHDLPADYVAERIEAVEAIEDPDAARDLRERGVLTKG